MQSFAPVGVPALNDQLQEVLWRIEIWDGAAWQDLSALGGSGGENYIKSVTLSMGGAGMTSAPVAATWSATIDNTNGIFHPFHPTSPYKNLLRMGREVRIWMGGVFGGSDVYRQRLAGFMEAPRFSHGSKTVEISGMDYTKLLSDTILRDVNPVTESGSGSGSGRVDDIIDGPLHWGRRASLNAIPSPGMDMGEDTYIGGDACAVGSDETNSAGGWIAETRHGAVAPIIQVIAPGDDSSYALRLFRWLATDEQSIIIPNATTGVTAGASFQISFRARRLHGSMPARLIAFNYEIDPMTPPRKVGEAVIGMTDGAWTSYSIVAHIATTGTLELKLYTGGDYAHAFDTVDIDNIVIRRYATDFWNRYLLPSVCNGPWLVTLNGEPVGQGPQEEGTGGWHYLEDTRALWFSDQMEVRSSAGGVRIYYYTTQVLENIVADLLAHSGLYADRATALADMDYVATGVSLERVWFDSGDSALTAITKICERVNYRFWFTYDGKPVFKPAPVAESVCYSIPPGCLRDASEYQDDGMVRNRISIEGAERAMYQVTRDDKADDCYKYEVSDAASIALYLEKDYQIKNQLFQSQSSTRMIAEVLLAESKDARWYSDLTLYANVVALEMGDLVSWAVELEPIDVDSASPRASGSGAVTVSFMGIIRDIKLNDSQAVYKVEVVDDLWSTGDLWSGSESALPGIDSGSAVVVPEDLCGIDVDGNDSSLEFISGSGESSGSPPGLEYIVPSGVDNVEFEGWGPGGSSSPEGGGGGGGAYARVSVAVTAGDKFYLYPCPSEDAPGPTVVKDAGGNVILSADYGQDGVGTAGGAGGLAANCTGDVKYNGGDGANADGGFGGGGGSSAGSGAAGSPASGRFGGEAPLDGYDGGLGGYIAGAPGGPGAGPGAGMGGRNPDDNRLPQPGRVRIKCQGAAESESVSGSITEEIYFGDDFGSSIEWQVPRPPGWNGLDTIRVTFECYGCGGSGGQWNSPPVGDDLARAGGGGGAYAKTTIDAMPDDYYDLYGATYGAFYYHEDSPTVVRKQGDIDDTCRADNGTTGWGSDVPGEGGDAALSVGDVVRSGGDGSARVSNSVGGGGGSCGDESGDGLSASGQSGAAAVGTWGRGGDGGGSDSNGEGITLPADISEDINPGGGGGGRGDKVSGSPGSGVGGASLIRITYQL